MASRRAFGYIDAVAIGRFSGAGMMLTPRDFLSSRVLAKRNPELRRRERRPAVEPLEKRELLAVKITFDYRFDTNHFFDQAPNARAVLDAAAAKLTSQLNDTLGAIVPSGLNTFVPQFDDPQTGQPHDPRKVAGLTIKQNEIVVFVGARSIPKANGNNTVRPAAETDNEWNGIKSGGSGTAGWTRYLQTRDVRSLTERLENYRTVTWGGAISFQTHTEFNPVTGLPDRDAFGRLTGKLYKFPWDFKLPEKTVEPRKVGIASVVVHELGHMLGFDGDNPWFNRHYGNGTGDFTTFSGDHAKAANRGNPIDVWDDKGGTHWAPSVTSNGRIASMVPGTAPSAEGWRPFTELDFAALKDIGWQVGTSSAGQQARFDADLKADPAVFRVASGTWYATQSSTPATLARQLGLPGDVPVNADFDGNGKSDYAVWRPDNGTWYFAKSPSGSLQMQQWGLPGDIPHAGDYNGDGKSDFAVFRPANNTWYVRILSDSSVVTQPWGESGDLPVPADYDGDGRIDLAVWRPSTGTWYVIGSTRGVFVQPTWGVAGDVPVPADYDGDGRTDFAVWRPSTGTWWIIRSRNGSGYSRQWGLSGDVPQPADYDADGRADLAVWRPGSANWHIQQSTTMTRRVHQWGLPGDLPVGNSMATVLARRVGAIATIARGFVTASSPTSVENDRSAHSPKGHSPAIETKLEEIAHAPLDSRSCKPRLQQRTSDFAPIHPSLVDDLLDSQELWEFDQE